MKGKLDQAIATAEADNRSEQIAAEAYVRERRALCEQIPSVWAKFKAAIRAECESKPRYLHFFVLPESEAKVERLGDRRHATLELRLLKESGVVEFECGNASGCCTIRLNRHNIAGICDQDGNPYRTEGAAAEEVLSLLFS